MSEIPDIRQFDNDQFLNWAPIAADIWYADEGPASKDHSIYDIFSINEEYRCYGLYVQEELVAIAGVSWSLFGRGETDRHLDRLAALPGPDAIGQKSALLSHAEDEAFEACYSTMTAMCPSHRFPFFQERGYRLIEESGVVMQVRKTLTRGNITPVRFGRR